MDNRVQRGSLTMALSLAAAGVIAVTTVSTVAPPGQTPTAVAPRVSTSAVALAALPEPLQSLWDLASGNDPAFPLPIPSNPIAPVAEQFVRNLATYGQQLASGEAGKIPGEIAAHLGNVGRVLGTLASELPLYVGGLLTSPVYGVVGGAFTGGFAALAVLSSVIGFGSDQADNPGSPLTLVIVAPIFLGGVALGAVLGPIVIPALATVRTALEIRNSLAVALASPAPVEPARVAGAAQTTAGSAQSPAEPDVHPTVARSARRASRVPTSITAVPSAASTRTASRSARAAAAASTTEATPRSDGHGRSARSARAAHPTS